MEYNIIACFILSLLSLSLLATPINGRKILEEIPGRESNQGFVSELIEELSIQGDTSSTSHSNPRDKSFISHLNPWANYWVYDNANKESSNNEVNEVKNKEDDLNQPKIEEMMKNLIKTKDKSFVGHLNPWANYWVYDNANKKSSKTNKNDVEENVDSNQSKIEEMMKNLIKSEDKSFVGHLNPWANYWVYDNANKKSSKDVNDVEENVDMNRSKFETMMKDLIMKSEDKSFVGHLNPWANYWVYDNANKKSPKNVNEKQFELETLNKEDKSFIGHLNPWANYWVYDNANKKSSKNDKNEDGNENKMLAENEKGEVVEQSKASNM